MNQALALHTPALATAARVIVPGHQQDRFVVTHRSVVFAETDEEH